MQHHLETFLARAQESEPGGSGVPSWVERNFRAYLRCGILAHGFARVRCGDCGQERTLPFSCKGRGVCPSCNARRMAEVAAHLTDRVLPHLPHGAAPRAARLSPARAPGPGRCRRYAHLAGHRRRKSFER